MGVPDFTLVVGIDQGHFNQLVLTWRTWKLHKPSLCKHPMVVFRDSRVPELLVQQYIDHPDLRVVQWPPKGDSIVYKRLCEGRFGDPQRYKMLAGFVHVPSLYVNTTYWMKLDTDVVATGKDNWIDPGWFDGDPAIVSHRWSYTKPADQIVTLDRWAEQLKLKSPPLGLVPVPGSEILKHKRVISWCAFFDTEFTKACASVASVNCGRYQLPVPSQDGYLWYMAQRLRRIVVPTNMKQRGWQQWMTNKNIVKHCKEVMERNRYVLA